MKRSTAIKNVHEIARRLSEIDGVLNTPLCSREGFRFKNVWVFGSTVKGSQSPNDLDILIEGEAFGEYKHWTEENGLMLDKWRYRAHGLTFAINSEDEAKKWLSKGMKMVSRHNYYCDALIAYPRMMIYPHFEFIDILQSISS